MTPNDIEVLLHFHVSLEEHEREHAPAVQETIAMFVRNGIIVKTDTSDSGYKPTDKGKVLINMLCNTPFPEQKWIDPR